MKKILLLGASGSIGIQTLDVIANHLEKFQLTAFSVGKQIDKAIEILNTFNVKYAYVLKKEDALKLAESYKDTTFFYGDKGLIELVENADYELLVNALVGFVGLRPTLRAIELKKDIALANKETLVAGGEIFKKAVAKYHVNLFPIDS